MRLLRADTEQLELEDVPNGSEKYAILSHRWLQAREEILYDDIASNKNIESLRSKAGWKKLNWTRQQAVKDGLCYVWADTACIDKRSSQELAESINSMYKWYQEAECCYVYLQDMPDPISGLSELSPFEDTAHAHPIAVSENGYYESAYDAQVNEPESCSEVRAGTRQPSHASIGTEKSPCVPLDDHFHLEPMIGQRNQASYRPSEIFQNWSHHSFAQSEWFSRAWTLQEMIASSALRFYSVSWIYIGDITELAADVARITGVHKDLLSKKRALESFSIAQKMSWAALRKSTKIEDRAYSLLGIMNVSMSIIYGEGLRAFARLQEELLRAPVSDDSIFAFGASKIADESEDDGPLMACPLLAESPEAFHDSGNVALLSWRQSNNQHQPNVKEVIFRARARTGLRSRSNGNPFRQWFAWSRNITHRQIILGCSFENNPSATLTLNLFARSDQPNVFYVRAGCRITSECLTGTKRTQCPYQNFSVALYPARNQNDVHSNPRTLILYRRKSPRLSLQLASTSRSDAWYPADETLVIGPEGGEIETELSVTTNGSYSCSMRLSGDRYLSWRRNIRLDPELFHLMESFRVSKRTQAGFIVAVLHSRKRYLGHLHASVVEVSIVGPRRLCLMLLTRILAMPLLKLGVLLIYISMALVCSAIVFAGPFLGLGTAATNDLGVWYWNLLWLASLTSIIACGTGLYKLLMWRRRINSS